MFGQLLKSLKLHSWFYASNNFASWLFVWVMWWFSLSSLAVELFYGPVDATSTTGRYSIGITVLVFATSAVGVGCLNTIRTWYWALYYNSPEYA